MNRSSTTIIKESTLLLSEILAARRSCRKYADRTPDPAQVERVVQVAQDACRTMGVESTSFRLISCGDEAKGLVQAMMSSPIGKINPWLTSIAETTPFLVTLGRQAPAQSRRDADEGDEPARESQTYLARAAYATEHGILAAAETGLATCWLGGFAEDDVGGFLDVNRDQGERVVGITPIGLPANSSPLSWDRLMGRISRNRNPLNQMVQGDGPWLEIPDKPEYRRGKRTDANLEPSPRPVEMERLVRQTGLSFNRAHSGIAPDNQTLLTLLQGGRLAPSACNFQTWRFRMIREQAAREQVGEVMGMAQAGESGVVCLANGVPGPISGRCPEQPFYMIDVPIAVAHLVLAGVEQGLTVSLKWIENRVQVKGLSDVCTQLDSLTTVAGGYRGDAKEQPVAVLALSAPSE